jgi:hypothetical protein
MSNNYSINTLIIEAQNNVRPYAHCEYTQGFIVFDRLDGNKEVWRRLSDFPSFTSGAFNAAQDYQKYVNTKAHPLTAMRRAGEAAEANQLALLLSSDSHGPHQQRRGFFKPWAYLTLPDNDSGRAYRLADNFILGVASRERVYLFDVRSGELVQTIDNIQGEVRAPLAPSIETLSASLQRRVGLIGDAITTWEEEDDILGGICYIDHNDDFVFLCGEVSLRVFDRKAGGQCVLHMLCGGMVGPRWFRLGEWERYFDRSADGELEVQPESQRLVGQDIQYYEADRLTRGHGLYDDMFVAGESILWDCPNIHTHAQLLDTIVHVSDCGKHLAALTTNSRLILLPYFSRCLVTAKNRFPIHEIAQEVIIGNTTFDNPIIEDASIYLAFCGENIGVATVSPFFSKEKTCI